MTRNDRAGAWAALLAAALCLILTAVRAQPPAPRGPSSDGFFSAVTAQKVLEELYAGDVRHHIGTENNRRLKEKILDHLRAIGYEPTVPEYRDVAELR